jgi:hypothetical protein
MRLTLLSIASDAFVDSSPVCLPRSDFGDRVGTVSSVDRDTAKHLSLWVHRQCLGSVFKDRELNQTRNFILASLFGKYSSAAVIKNWVLIYPCS